MAGLNFAMAHMVGKTVDDSCLKTAKTKIVCSLGPKSREGSILEDLLKAGMNVARFNFSHGTHEYHQYKLDNLRQAMLNIQIMYAILLDTKGPEIRTGNLALGKPIQLVRDREIWITTHYLHLGDENMIAMSYPKLAIDLVPVKTILCSDETITMMVLECHPERDLVKCRCENSAMLGEKKNVNLPRIVVDLLTITQKQERFHFDLLNQEITR